MKKILYFMHIPWGWIKQRPHLIAEQLAQSNDVTVVQRRVYRTAKLTKNACPIRRRLLFVFPFERFRFFIAINNLLVSFQLKQRIRKYGYDMVWVTDARLYVYLKNMLTSDVKIIYDCMDNTIEFPDIKVNTAAVNSFLQTEKELIHKSYHTFFSSKVLQKTVLSRYQLEIDTGKTSVVNNAYSNQAIETSDDAESSIKNQIISQMTNYQKQGLHVITYIGTISAWLDTTMILNHVESHHDIIYFFVGPVEHETNRIHHKRIIYTNAVPHCSINVIMDHSDVLIMPFLVTPLVESVDPVKIYEYISRNKPIVAVRYEETEKFSNFVKLYSNAKEYNKAIQESIQQLSFSTNTEQVMSFINNNNWNARAISMNNVIQRL